MPWWANTEWANTEWANTRFAPTWHNIIQLLIVNCHAWYMVRTAPIRAIRAICVRTPHKKRANTRFAPTRHTDGCLLMAEITPGGIFISMPWWAYTEWANTRLAPTWHNIIQLLMVNCQLSCVVHGTYCAHSRHSRHLRSDTTQKKGEHKVRPYTAYRRLFADG